MKSAKLGAIFLMSVLALAGIGMGYAAWTDTITIDGTINTGDVDLNVVALSGYWVYKILPTHGTFEWHGWANMETGEPLDDIEAVSGYVMADLELIAYSTARMDLTDPDGDTVILTWHNLFPCIDFITDIVFHYDGSIPAIIDDTTFYNIETGADWVNDLIASEDVWAMCYRTEDPIAYIKPDLMPIGEEVWVGYQLHECNYFKLDIHFHIPQDPIYMGLTASGSAEINVIQWNEYGLP